MLISDVVLRALRPLDDRALTDLFADADVAIWNPGPDVTEVARWRGENTEDADDFCTRAISTPGGRLLGVVSVFSIDRERHSAEVGFRVTPEARGRGVGRAGLALIIDLIANERRIRGIEAFHAVGNPASCAVLGACGFVLVDLLPANYEYGDGRLHDEHRHLLETG